MTVTETETACGANGVESVTELNSSDECGARVDYGLDRLERLAELLAVEGGYEPAVRDFVLPRNFRLSVVIPVFNEAGTIRQVITHVAALPIPKEIIIVDDASTDGTREGPS